MRSGLVRSRPCVGARSTGLVVDEGQEFVAVGGQSRSQWLSLRAGVDRFTVKSLGEVPLSKGSHGSDGDGCLGWKSLHRLFGITRETLNL